MRFKTMLVAALLALVAVAGALALWFGQGPNPADFADLREPRITRMNDQRMLVVEATGDPNVVGADAFKLLFGTYFKLDGVSRAAGTPAPRARWPRPLDTPKAAWLGQYALPVPTGAALPAPPAGTLRVTIATWVYGDVAEILHVGPYNAEQADTERLLHFVAERGYRVVGDHEEEYVKGPGMFFAGDPAKYLTIIRLRVERGTGNQPGAGT